MPTVEPGFQRKYFKDDTHSEINRINVTVHNFGGRMDFYVSDEKAEAVQILIGDVATMHSNIMSPGVWFYIKGIENIKNTLSILSENDLISEDFYKSIMEAFPKPGGGMINLFEKPFPLGKSQRRLSERRGIHLIRLTLPGSEEFSSRTSGILSGLRVSPRLILSEDEEKLQISKAHDDELCTIEGKIRERVFAAAFGKPMGANLRRRERVAEANTDNAAEDLCAEMGEKSFHRP